MGLYAPSFFFFHINLFGRHKDNLNARGEIRMAITRKGFTTKAIRDIIYPLVEAGMNKNMLAWKKCMSNFMQKRSSVLFDIMPADRIVFSDADAKELFDALKLNVRDIENGLRETYYWDINPFKPSSAKDPLTIVALCIIRYFIFKKDTKNLSLAMIYNAFSGKYYPSIHYGFFKLVTPAKYRHIMEFVVNHKLSHKFDLKAAGSVIAAIKNTNETWVKSYEKMFKSFEDEDCTYIIQQLHNRIKSFMKNIAAVYYEAYNSKEYMTYDSDSIPEEEGIGSYHLATNDSFKLQQYVENTMNRIATTQVDYKTCKSSADANVKTEEIRSIIEAILNNRDNIPKVREFITCMIAAYMEQAEGSKDIMSIKFFKFAVSPKPNTKNPSVIRMGELLEELLEDNSIGYRKRKHRVATKSSYHKGLCTYFAITAINANK